jgi:hypothetical protein
MSSGLNIGVRHVLPVYPFLAVLASSLFWRPAETASRRPRIAPIAAGLLALHAAASFAAHPDYLSYFNELARGREHRILADSNLDWGQDLARLADYLERNGIKTVHLRYWGPSRPEIAGIEDYQFLGAQDRPSGWVAVSVTYLQGLWLGKEGGDFSWLRRHEPVDKVGKSIWIYHLP